MDRNTELATAGVPSVNRARTTFKYNVRHMTTFNIGQLVPFYFNMLVQPGDTFSINLNTFLRLTTSKFPSMDNLTADIYFFAIRWLNIFNHTKEFWGENSTSPWEQDTTYQLPQLTIDASDTINKDSLLNHLGVPNLQANKNAGGVSNSRNNPFTINRLGYNMYWFIVNEWFRDENYEAPYEWSADDGTISYSTLGTQQNLYNVNRFHDYFSTVVPEPQKGTAELLPFAGEVPVIGNGKSIGLTISSTGTPHPLTGSVGSTTTDGRLFINGSTESVNVGTEMGNTVAGNGQNNQWAVGLVNDPNNSGMIADITNAVSATINALRIIVVQQQIKERNAIFGSRFREVIKGRWGVTSPELANNIPEYLGGVRFPLNMDTVLQTSSTDSVTPQGSPAGYSVTSDSNHMFTKSFDQWYCIMGLICVRQDHTYSQGLPIQLQKLDPIDFWQPEFDNIGLQPIYSSELYLTGGNKKQAIGYRMPWQEYRLENSFASGEMAPAAPTNLAYYNYADFYTSNPGAISREWMEETPDFVDRTLVVDSTETHQLMMDTVCEVTKVTEVSRFSIPGLDRF